MEIKKKILLSNNIYVFTLLNTRDLYCLKNNNYSSIFT